VPLSGDTIPGVYRKHVEFLCNCLQFWQNRDRKRDPKTPFARLKLDRHRLAVF